MTDYTNLRNKTVFDFCEDKKILRKVLRVVITPKLKEEYHQRYLIDPLGNAFALSYFAETTKNKDLYNAVEREFKKEFTLFFNE